MVMSIVRLHTSVPYIAEHTLCSLVDDYQHFGGTYNQHLQGTLNMEAESSSKPVVTTYKATLWHDNLSDRMFLNKSHKLYKMACGIILSYLHVSVKIMMEPFLFFS
jgi:hypothetical protein